ncbi:MAG: HAD-IIIA family hydrolase [Burkholderiaceae bacterium]|nr:HAD-IIIA family hydrolase [Burkholderiaceae bacterium]
MKLVILDRDGTLNPLGDDFITCADEWEPLPGALEAVARLNHAGWHVVVVSNQPGLGRGLFDVVALNALHAKLYRQLAAVGGRVDAVFFCPHTPDEHCHCRAPAPGLLEQIVERYGVDPRDVQVVGSSLDWALAGMALGARVHGLPPGREAPAGTEALPAPESLPSFPPFPPPVRRHASLTAMVAELLAAPPASGAAAAA